MYIKVKRKAKMEIRRCVGISAVLTILIALVCCCVTFADENQADHTEKIRVGYPLLKAVHEMDSQGRYWGYNYEYLQEIAGETGWKYEFVVDSWDNCVKGLENGTIDMMGFLLKSDAREEFLEYSRIPAGASNVVLVADQDNKNLNYMDFKSLKDCKTGLLRGTGLEVKLDAFCDENNLKVEKAYYTNEDDMFEALDDGKVDLVLSTNFEVGIGTRVVADFTSDTFYFAVSKESPRSEIVINELNDAMNHILLLEPNHNQNLLSGYIYGANKKILNFTTEERDFIKHSGPIKVVYDANWTPMSYYDEKTEQAAGVVVSLFGKIEEDTGLKFEFVRTKNYSEALERIKKGEADIISNTPKDYTWAEDFNLYLTVPYARLPVEFVSNSITETDLLVMPKNYIPYQKAKQLQEIYSVTYVESIEECYQAVKEGSAKATFANAYVNSYMRNIPEYRELHTSPSVESSAEICLGTYRGAPEELVSIMDKVILNITEEEVNHFAMTELTKMEDKSLGGWIFRNPSKAIGMAVVFFGIILITMIIYMRERQRREKAMQYNLVTGIWNFSKFVLEANRRLTNYSGADSYAMLHIDICKFKFLNDNYGFEMGNTVLRTMGVELGHFARNGELYGSLWADHFVCLVKFTGEDDLKERVWQLLDSLNEKLVDTCDFNVTIKAGVYCITKEDTGGKADTNLMLQYANHALATINDTYKNSMAFFDQNLRKEIENFRMINKDMISAFYDKQFVPYYQPKFNIFTKEILGAEALVRWIHPEKGLMQPCEFLPSFERSGFIVEVDLYVFEETCKNIKRWIDWGKEPIIISCNFSRLHVENKNFVKQIKEIVAKYEIPNDLLELELTETIAVEEMEDITTQISDLHDAGFHVSIDDFGSGYSSLSVLQQLKVDTIKLDRTFLQNGIPTDRECKVMGAIVDLAEQLHMKVICEGVETLEQVELLKNTNCVAAQGFYFARPMPVEELEKLLLPKKIKEQ